MPDHSPDHAPVHLPDRERLFFTIDSEIRLLAPPGREDFRRAIRAFLAAALSVSLGATLIACSSPPPTPSELQAIQESVDAYLLYASGNCEAVLRETDPDAIGGWEENEIRHSMLLLHGFCLENVGEIEAAQEVYRDLLRNARNSFAAQDAFERLRILKIEAEDPDQARWMHAVRERTDPSSRTRTPIERVPARFPPLPRAAGIEGFAVVEFGVDPKGETVDPVIADSQPPLLFDGSALRAVRRWTFSPDRQADPDHRQIIRILFKYDRSIESDPGEGEIEDATG